MTKKDFELLVSTNRELAKRKLASEVFYSFDPEDREEAFVDLMVGLGTTLEFITDENLIEYMSDINN